MKGNQQLIAWIMLFGLALVWGSSFILIKKGLVFFDPGEVAAIRIISASIFLLPIAIRGLKEVRTKHWILLASVGFVGSFIPAFLFAKAQTQLPSALAGIINALTPLFTMLLGTLFFHVKVTMKTYLGLLLGLVGTVVLILKNDIDALSGINYYALYVVLATLLYGINLNLIKYKIPDLSAKTITSISLLLVGPLALVYILFFTDISADLQSGSDVWLPFFGLVALGVFGTALALVVFNELVKITTPIFTSSVTYLIPIVALVWGLIDGESLFANQFIGMVLIIVGVYISNVRRKKS